MPRELTKKSSIGSRLREHCANAIHTLKQISSAVLLHNDNDNDVDNLFANLDSDEEAREYTEALQIDKIQQREAKNELKHSKSIPTSKNTTTTSTRTSTVSDKSIGTAITSIDSNLETQPRGKVPPAECENGVIDTTDYSDMSGPELWEKQRDEWLTPTVAKSVYQKRKTSHRLGQLAEYNDDVYLSVYRNLVVYGKPLKHGLNMSDGFKVIYTGWENSKMFERVAKGLPP